MRTSCSTDSPNRRRNSATETDTPPISHNSPDPTWPRINAARSTRTNVIRVNGARAAGRLAMDRCIALGGSCGLYAVDNAVVWEDRDAARLAASR